MGRLMIFLAIAGIMTIQRSFVNPAALPDHGENGAAHEIGGHVPDQDQEVQELESLKHPQSEGQSIEIVKSKSTSTSVDETGKEDKKIDLSEYIDENGKLVARVHHHGESTKKQGEKPHEHSSTEIEVPSEGVHHTIVHDSTTEGQKETVKAFPGAARLLQSSGEAIPQPPPVNQEETSNGNRRSFNADLTQEENNNMDHYSAYSGVQYSPLDMAEYIFWTGDEKGVTLAIEEFLEEGMMSREEAIGFLQEIKYNLDYLQTHYAQQRLRSAIEEKLHENQENQLANIELNNQRASSLRKFNHDNLLRAITSGAYERSNNIPLNIPQLPPNYPELRQDIYKKSEDNYLRGGYKPVDQYEKENTPAISEEDYEELMEKLRLAEFFYTEYSLEEVIYQLAKVMFTQSLARGSNEAQSALQKFTNFLEYEASQGRITKALEKKVLDVLIEALSDTLIEHPELVATARIGFGGESAISQENKVLRQILELGSTEQGNTGMLAAYREGMKAQKHKQQPGWMKSKMQSEGEHHPATQKHFKMSV